MRPEASELCLGSSSGTLHLAIGQEATLRQARPEMASEALQSFPAFTYEPPPFAQSGFGLSVLMCMSFVLYDSV